jgi:6-pyruvoyltetrahydropterin/6-carboxytetrahydropterin synthase
MHKLSRHVRFSVNPFLPKDSNGFNSYASEPSGEGLSVFFELGVELAGEVEPTTGFVVNVTDIDKGVRESVVPVFAKKLRDDYRKGKHISILGLARLLTTAWRQLADRFTAAEIDKLTLKLNPFRRIAIDCKDSEMVYFSEKFEFAATHKLWNDDFSEQQNLDVFGKCANPAGHGHNYLVEVTVTTPADRSDFRIGDFERTVDSELIKLVDHKNLNVELEEFRTTNPTVENIAGYAWKKLTGKFGQAKLHCITIWETDKTYCSYYGK